MTGRGVTAEVPPALLVKLCQVYSVTEGKGQHHCDIHVSLPAFFKAGPWKGFLTQFSLSELRLGVMFSSFVGVMFFLASLEQSLRSVKFYWALGFLHSGESATKPGCRAF